MNMRKIRKKIKEKGLEEEGKKEDEGKEKRRMK